MNGNENCDCGDGRVLSEEDCREACRWCGESSLANVASRCSTLTLRRDARMSVDLERHRRMSRRVARSIPLRVILTTS